MSLVQMKDVVKRYGDKISVDHLNLNIEDGEIFGFLGPNGAGKSTTIKMLSGLLPLNGGDIRVDGFSIKRDPIKVKQRIGVVPQELAIYEDISARDNITFFAKLYGLRGKELAGRVEEALAFVGLADKAKDRPSSFSGGMKRRLNIACAIAHRPKLIVMDEPTVGIDPQSRNHILESVKQLNAMGSTIIYTSHYMEEVSAICTRVGIMDQGHLIASGSHEELRSTVDDTERITLKLSGGAMAEAEQELQRHPRIRQVTLGEQELQLLLQPSESGLQDILFILSKHGVNIQSLTRVEPNLEYLFLMLTGRNLRD